MSKNIFLWSISLWICFKCFTLESIIPVKISTFDFLTCFDQVKFKDSIPLRAQILSHIWFRKMCVCVFWPNTRNKYKFFIHATLIKMFQVVKCLRWIISMFLPDFIWVLASLWTTNAIISGVYGVTFKYGTLKNSWLTLLIGWQRKR